MHEPGSYGLKHKFFVLFQNIILSTIYNNERPSCIGYTNSSRRQAVACPIQHDYDCEYCTCDTNGCKRSYSSKILENEIECF